MGKQTNNILSGLSSNQRKAAAAPGHDVIVRAGAGSGKTKTLVARFLFLLDENRDWKPENIPAVTFTKKAAREMQSRIRTEMMKLAMASDGDERQFWLRRMTEMDNACIGTIHSLCSRILRAYPAEAGLDPKFGVLDENNGAVLFEQVIGEMISEISTDPEFADLLNFYSELNLSKILTAMLKSRSRVDRAMQNSPVKTMDALQDHVSSVLYNSEIPEIISEYREMIQEPDFDKSAGKIADNIRNLVNAFSSACELFSNSRDPMECLSELYRPFNSWKFNVGPKLKANAKKIKDFLCNEFPFLADDDHDLEYYKEQWEIYGSAEAELRKLWPRLRKKYTDKLDAAELIDFEMMESLTLNLLRDNPKIRVDIQSCYKSILVDEYQDTNEDQTEIFSLLDPDHDRLFAVGDKKQSIYAFRGTNVALFDQRGASVIAAGGDDIVLDETYRTHQALLEPMGKMLESMMADEMLSEEKFYASYEPMRAGRLHAPKSGPFIEVLIGEIAAKKGSTDFTTCANLLAERITELKGSGEIYEWNDVAVLCRRTKDFQFFEAAFSAWNIPYVTVAGQGFYDRPEIREVKTMLRAAENPYDDTAITGFLLSPVIGFTPEMMVGIYKRANSGSQKSSFHHVLMDEAFSYENPVKQQKLLRARDILHKLTHLAGQVPVDEVLAELYRLTGMRTMLALDNTDRAWQNLDKLLFDAQKSGIASVSEFLNYLDQIKESGAREGEAPADNGGAVRIMTIHQAKGLEFPITVIGGASVSYQLRAEQFYVDDHGSIVFISTPATPQYTAQKKQAEKADKAEWLRLLYVAATRAERKLIFCGNPTGDTSDSWIKRLLSSLPDEVGSSTDYIGPAFGIEDEILMIHGAENAPEPPEGVNCEEIQKKHTAETDTSLLMPLPSREFEVKNEDQAYSLTVGKMVHKGIELWRFPENDTVDDVLNSALDRLLMQSERLSPEEQKAAKAKAILLLNRFCESDAYRIIEKSNRCWHELPFSIPGKNFVVNGVIDLLLETSGSFTIVDFKTDDLKSLKDLNEAVQNHEKQLMGYRKAIRMTLGVDPKVVICFLDFCGSVEWYLFNDDGHEEGRNEINPDDYPENTQDEFDGWGMPKIPEPIDFE